MDSITQFIGSLGFPIAVAVYFMLKMEKALKEYAASNNKLNETLAGIKEVISKCKGQNGRAE